MGGQTGLWLSAVDNVQWQWPANKAFQVIGRRKPALSHRLKLLPTSNNPFLFSLSLSHVAVLLFKLMLHNVQCFKSIIHLACGRQF